MKIRIVSNGLKFRLQWFGKKGLFGRNKWHWVYRIHYTEGEYIPEFNSREEAEKVAEKARKQFEANKRGWRPL